MGRNIIAICLLGLLSVAEAITDGWSIPIEHSFGDTSNFQLRGHIELGKARPGGSVLAVFVPGPSLSHEERERVAEGAQNGGLYFIRAPTSLNDRSISGDNYVMSFTETCRLLKSELNEVIALSVDSASQKVISIVPQPLIDPREDYPLQCGADSSEVLSNTFVFGNFNTTVRVVDVVDGPSPDTQAFIQRREQERQDRARGEQVDNRHWLAKYWMYIVPVVILMMLSSGMNADQGGGGGR